MTFDQVVSGMPLERARPVLQEERREHGFLAGEFTPTFAATLKYLCKPEKPMLIKQCVETAGVNPDNNMWIAQEMEEIPTPSGSDICLGRSVVAQQVY